MPSRAKSHVLQDPHQVDAISKRLKRAQGQMGAVIRMLEDGRGCDEIVTQLAAVAKAVNTAAFKMISASLKECIEDPLIDHEDIAASLQRLFLSLA